MRVNLIEGNGIIIGINHEKLIAIAFMAKNTTSQVTAFKFGFRSLGGL